MSKSQGTTGAMEGRYITRVIMQLTGIKASYLRRLHEAGLLNPHRTCGGHRLYTQKDLKIITKVAPLKDRRIKLAGIKAMLNKNNN
ncbi:MAG: MerR family transcriptional regulator [Dehalococcoidaceae bacterium]|nr:MerR family transcriptional regulator [Dehalococcoidaceae bacterium]